MPYGALTDVLLAASAKCSETMFIVHSPLSTRFRKVSFAFSKPPANPTINIGGSFVSQFHFSGNGQIEPTWLTT